MRGAFIKRWRFSRTVRLIVVLVLMLALVVVSAYVIDVAASMVRAMVALLSLGGIYVAGEAVGVARAAAVTVLVMLVAATLITMIVVLAYSLRAAPARR